MKWSLRALGVGSQTRSDPVGRVSNRGTTKPANRKWSNFPTALGDRQMPELGYCPG